eukprot:6202653-Pleurochrysis_carterae.AAC.5
MSAACAYTFASLFDRLALGAASFVHKCSRFEQALAIGLEHWSDVQHEQFRLQLLPPSPPSPPPTPALAPSLPISEPRDSALSPRACMMG